MEFSSNSEITQVVKEIIQEHGLVSFSDLLRGIDYSYREVIHSLIELTRRGNIVNEDGVFRVNESSLNQAAKSSNHCRLCQGKTIISDEHQIALMKHIVRERPTPDVSITQRPVTPETSLNRISYMFNRRDIEGRNIVFIGDDDLSSIATAIHGTAKSITVLEVDTRILTYIEKVAKEYGWMINLVEYDAQHSIPGPLVGQFDIFFTDPAPTIPCFELFLSRAVELCQLSGTSVGYTSAFPTHTEKQLAYLALFSRLGLLITDMIPFFNEYEFIPSILDSASQEFLKAIPPHLYQFSFTETLIRFEFTSETHPSTTGNVSIDSKVLYG